MFYTLRGAAKYLGLSRSTVRNRVRAKAFPDADDMVASDQTAHAVWAEDTLADYAADPGAWTAHAKKKRTTYAERLSNG